MADQDNEIHVIGNGEVLMLDVFALAGNGVIVQEGKVVAAIQTTGPLIDLTLTKEQAKVLAEKLSVAAKSIP